MKEKKDAELARAQDPGTPAETLRQLGKHPRPEVKAAVAANPNVPPDVLWTLADAFPEQVLGNPGLELLSLEDPLWLHRPHPGVVHRLMNREQAPAWFVEQALSGPLALRRLIALGTKRQDVLWRLARGALATEKELLAALFNNTHSPASLLEHLLAEQGMAAILPAFLGRYPTQRERANQPTYFLEAALESGLLEGLPEEPRQKLFNHLPERHLERLAMSPDVKIRMAVARSSSVPLTLLVRLTRDPSRQVREAVALNARCPQVLSHALRQAESRRLRLLPQSA